MDWATAGAATADAATPRPAAFKNSRRFMTFPLSPVFCRREKGLQSEPRRLLTPTVRLSLRNKDPRRNGHSAAVSQCNMILPRDAWTYRGEAPAAFNRLSYTSRGRNCRL